jgi:citrate lyase beta subunit
MTWQPICGCLPGRAGDRCRWLFSRIVLAARAEQIAVFDGVYNQLDDLEGFAAEAAEGTTLGFDGSR